jgi:peptidoglycan/LPS O-acetylase OafA/YrhL
MGFFRFFLALAVVIFHSGWGGGAGPLAVFMFYILSGFVITRVLDVRYVNYKSFVLKFYASRAIKLLPIYLVTCFLTMMISLFFSQNSNLQNVASTGAYIKTEYSNFIELLLVNIMPTFVVKTSPVLTFFSGFTLVPQYWTIGVEALFYLLTPIVFYLSAKKSNITYGVLFIICFVYYLYSCFVTYLNYQDFLDSNYRNAFTSLFFFWWGGLLYFFTKTYSYRFNPLISTIVGLIFLIAILASAHISLSGQPSIDFFLWQISICIFSIPILLTAPSPLRLQKCNNFLGELSYPLYVMHFMVVGSIVYLLTWLEGYDSVLFSVKNREITPQWAIWAYVISLSVFMSIIATYLIDRPILTIRNTFLHLQSGDSKDQRPA